MKRKCFALLMACALAFLLPSGVLAEQSLEKAESQILVSSVTEQFEDGSSLITTIYQDSVPRQSRSGVMEQDGHKTVFFETAGGTALEYTVYGTFQYDGSRAAAVDAWDGYDIYESGWSCTSHSAYTSGASAKGSASFRHRDGTRKKLSATLTCSASGKLS